MAELGYHEGDNFIFDHVRIPNAEAREAVYRDIIARKLNIIVLAASACIADGRSNYRQ